MTEEDREDQLRTCQDDRVYPLGRALRSTYNSDNHDTLGTDVTGLMIDLSKVPFDAHTSVARAAAVDRTPPAMPVQPRSWWGRLGDIWGRTAS